MGDRGPRRAGANGAALSCGANYPNNALSWMVYGPFSLVGATAADMTLWFWLSTVENGDTLFYGASTNGANFYGYGFYGSTGGAWVPADGNGTNPDRLDLAAVPTLGNTLGQANVWVAVVLQTNASNRVPEGAFVDAVSNLWHELCGLLLVIQHSSQLQRRPAQIAGLVGAPACPLLANGEPNSGQGPASRGVGAFVAPACDVRRRLGCRRGGRIRRRARGFTLEGTVT